MVVYDADDGVRQEDQRPKQIEPQDFAVPTADYGSLFGTVRLVEQFPE